MPPYSLTPSTTPGAQVSEIAPGRWRLEIPAGPGDAYRLAQLDDYGNKMRRLFPHRAPFSMELRARASAPELPGTWGFGLWNNPFGMAILSGVEVLRLPALPNTAWYFFASPPNHLALQEGMPADGWMAATFRAQGLAGLKQLSPAQRIQLAALSNPAVALGTLALAPMALLRGLGRRLVQQAGAALPHDPTLWHTYALDWQPQSVTFTVDGEIVLVSSHPPRPPLGLVIWIDNQWAALPPRRPPGVGVLPNPQPAWIEIENLIIS